MKIFIITLGIVFLSTASAFTDTEVIESMEEIKESIPSEKTEVKEKESKKEEKDLVEFNVRHIHGFLRSEMQLAPDQREMLRAYVDSLDFEDENEVDLQEFEQLLKRKVQYDKDALSDIVITLGKMLDLDYAKKISRLNKLDIRKLKKEVGRLEKRILDVTPATYQRPKRAKNRAYKDTIEDLSKILLETDSSDSVVGIWESVSDKLRKSYDKWNEHQKELMKVVQDSKRKFYDPYKELKYDEYRFTQTFALLQALVRRFEGYGNLEY